MLSGVCCQGDLVRGDLVRWDLVRGDLVRGDLVRGDFVRGDFVRGDFVRGDFVLEPTDTAGAGHSHRQNIDCLLLFFFFHYVLEIILLPICLNKYLITGSAQLRRHIMCSQGQMVYSDIYSNGVSNDIIGMSEGAGSRKESMSLI